MAVGSGSFSLVGCTGNESGFEKTAASVEQIALPSSPYAVIAQLYSPGFGTKPSTNFSILVSVVSNLTVLPFELVN